MLKLFSHEEAKELLQVFSTSSKITQKHGSTTPERLGRAEVNSDENIQVNDYLQMKTDGLQELVGGVPRQEGHKHVLKDKECR